MEANNRWLSSILGWPVFYLTLQILVMTNIATGA